MRQHKENRLIFATIEFRNARVSTTAYLWSSNPLVNIIYIFYIEDSGTVIEVYTVVTLNLHENATLL